jgi:hypothetical protein
MDRVKTPVSITIRCKTPNQNGKIKFILTPAKKFYNRYDEFK